MYNLLTEPTIRYDQSNGGRVEASLPDVYAALMSDEVQAFSALRPHQRHAWHAFLVQLGAMAMHRAGFDTPPSDAAEWLRIIRALTPDWPDDEPWQLVVDIEQPAFMQPPASSPEREKDYKGRGETPDELDMLVTSKNHDLKSAVAEQARADDWIFALISLQTMEGFGGRYNYGISRMPSGYGNRPAFSLTPSIHPGAHFKHDLIALIKHRQSVLDAYPMTDSGIALLWVVPWDGTKAESKLLTEMEPYYIEICRRVRLNWQGGRIMATRANADAKRITDVKGLTGDPWAPVSNNANPRGTPPAFLGPRKFNYERVVDGLLSPDWKTPILLQQTRSEGDMQLVARGMVRGEGRTEGYHERVIPLRQRTIQIFGRSGGTEEIGDIARKRIERVAVVQRILRYAVSVFAAGGRTESIPDEHRTRANSWANKLTEAVDDGFFEALQDEIDAEDADKDRIFNEWLRGVVDDAHNILLGAIASLPCPEIRRHKAQVQAEGVFWGQVRGPNGLTELFQKFNVEGEEWQNNDQSSQVENQTETQMTMFQ